MNLGVLFSFLIAHMLADFVFQTASCAEKRNSSSQLLRYRATLTHTAVYGFCTLVAAAFYSTTLSSILITMGLIISHGLIDFGKGELVCKKPVAKHSVLLFGTDQLLHICLIFAASYLMSTDLQNSTYLQRLLSGLLKTYQTSISTITKPEIALLIILLLLIGLWGIGVFIKIVTNNLKFRQFNKLNPAEFRELEQIKQHGMTRGGFVIGILERITIITAITGNQFMVIGFLLAVKSIARFKKLDDEHFAEYFIIGSFISIFSSVLIGTLVSRLFHQLFN